MEVKDSEKHSSLLRYIINYDNKMFCTAGTSFTTLRFLGNLRMGPMNLSVTSHKAGKACQGKTLYLIGPSRNYGRILIIMNITPGQVLDVATVINTC